MVNKTFLRFFLSIFLTLSLFAGVLPTAGMAQDSAAAKASEISNLQKRLAHIEKTVEKRRKELGIPGLSLAIVKDGKVVMSKGFGYKNFEKKIPVTADTQFAIGSATKAFAALSVLMSKDEGKLSLNDSPKKYIPYFKIKDPEIDEKITIKNLLTHSSGLNRTDLGWYTGKLTREEIIKIAGIAEPSAKLGEKFQYQNVMYLAAGEIVAKVQGKTWEAFVAQEVLKPLGMLDSNVSVLEMQKAKDYSFGYIYNFDTKETRLLPIRDISVIAPAGSINSSANDMTKWLKFILNEGKIGDKRLISEESFKEWTKPHQKVSPNSNASYGLGWFVQEWQGKKVIQHGGNIDGFNSMVATLPQEELGFVMLTNVSGSSLGNELIQLVFSTMTGEFKQPEKVVTNLAEAEKEVGIYRLEAANLDIQVKIEDGNLVAVVPGQPTYVLAKIEGRKYKLTGVDGFFITFNDNDALLTQPNGKFDLKKISAKKDDVKGSDVAEELIGKYESEMQKGVIIEIKEVNGKVSLVIPGQQPYALMEKEEDVFRMNPLPESYMLNVRRSNDANLEGITIVQPEGKFNFTYLGEVTEENTKEIFGTYKLETPPAYEIKISAQNGKTYLRVPNQPPYELKEKEKDIYFSPTIPDTLKKIEVKRDTEGNIVGLISNEPSGTYSFKRIKVEKPKISAQELIFKIIEALGGEENWKKLKTRMLKAEIDYINQGLKGTSVSYSKAPNASATKISVSALGKQIATINEYFDGEKGGSDNSFAVSETLAGQPLEDAKFNNEFYGFVSWKDKLKNAEIVRFGKIGEEKVYVLSIEPEKASKVTYYISTETFLPIRKRSIVNSSTSPQKIPIVENYSDYREINGVMMPFKVEILHPSMGKIVADIKEVEHNVEIDDTIFRAKKDK